MHIWFILIILCAGIHDPYYLHDQKAAGFTIEGTVKMPDMTTSKGKRSPYGNKTSVSKKEDESTAAVIWLEQVNEYKINQTTVQVLNQKDIQFEPRLMVVRQGERIQVKNSDPVYHNVFSLSSVKKFDIGRRTQGEAVEVIFEKEGLIKLFCDIHTEMNAEILVVSNKTRIWTLTNQQQRFVLNDIPPGQYTLHAYASGCQQNSTAITVTDKPVTTNIILTK